MPFSTSPSSLGLFIRFYSEGVFLVGILTETLIPGDSGDRTWGRHSVVSGVTSSGYNVIESILQSFFFSPAELNWSLFGNSYATNHRTHSRPYQTFGSVYLGFYPDVYHLLTVFMACFSLGLDKTRLCRCMSFSLWSYMEKMIFLIDW